MTTEAALGLIGGTFGLFTGTLPSLSVWCFHWYRVIFFTGTVPSLSVSPSPSPYLGMARYYQQRAHAFVELKAKNAYGEKYWPLESHSMLMLDLAQITDRRKPKETH